MREQNAQLETKMIHSAGSPDPSTGAVIPPVHMTSTYVQESPGEHKGFEYSRQANPTRSNLEQTVASLEDGDWGRCFASGCSAANTLLNLLSSGDHVLCGEDLYGGTYRLFEKVFRKFDLEFSYVDTTEPKEVEEGLQPNTRMVWIETPSNPLLRVSDIEKTYQKIQSRNDIYFVVDNTFATPYLQQPLDMGADLVLHSMTKYLGGHSDIIGGAVVGNDPDLLEEISFYQKTIGGTPGPMDCWLVLRGIKTLHLRMQSHCKNARAIVDFLQNHPRVKSVFYPGISEHNTHNIAQKQMKDYGGMVSFELDGSLEEAQEMVSSTEFFVLAESLGGVESLIEHPASMTHASVPPEKREKLGISDSLIRLSVGVEEQTDLLNDLQQAL